MEIIRICYIVEHLRNYMGMERVLSLKASWLAKHPEYEVWIVTAKQCGIPYAYKLDKNIHCHDLNINIPPNHYYFKEWKKKLTLFFEENGVFDIAISTGSKEVEFLYSIRNIKHKIVEYHFTFLHNYESITIKDKSLGTKVKAFLSTVRYLWYIRKYEYLITLNNKEKQNWEKWCNNVTCIMNPITIPYSKLKAKGNTKKIISVGSLGLRKGHDVLIEVWAKVVEKHPDWKLCVYGDGDIWEFLNNKIRQYNVQDSFFLKGAVPEIETKYLESSIMVSSARFEGFGLCIVEAEYFGLPVVAYDVPSGPAEIITDGVDGFLIKPFGNIEEMARKICFLIENPDKRNMMGRNASKNSERFSVNTIMKQWDKLLKGIAKN